MAVAAARAARLPLAIPQAAAALVSMVREGMEPLVLLVWQALTEVPQVALPFSAHPMRAYSAAAVAGAELPLMQQVLLAAMRCAAVAAAVQAAAKEMLFTERAARAALVATALAE